MIGTRLFRSCPERTSLPVSNRLILALTLTRASSSQAPFVLLLSSPVPSSNSTHSPDTPQVTALPIPANTTLYLSIQGVNRDPTIWGADADEFRPERWLGKEKEGVSKARGRVPSLWRDV